MVTVEISEKQKTSWYVKWKIYNAHKKYFENTRKNIWNGFFYQYLKL